MRRLVLVTILSIGAIVTALAQDARQLRIDHAISSAERICLVGNKYKFSMDVTGKVEIMKLAPGANATVKFDRAEATGGVLFDNEQVRHLVDNDIRDCMKDQWPKVLLELDEPKPQKQSKGNQGDTGLASINRTLLAKTGFALGAPFDSQGGTVRSEHLSNDVLTGDYKYISYASRDNNQTTITIYLNAQSEIKGIKIENEHPQDTSRRVLKTMYLSMIRSWGDATPVNLIETTVTKPTAYGPVRTLWQQDHVHTKDDVKYFYYFRKKLDEIYPDREAIMIGLEH
jgi:hypothetical protein